MGYSLSEMAVILNGQLFHFGLATNQTIRYPDFDNRIILSGQGTLFFALRNERNDGRHYITDAIDKEVA